MNLTCNSSIDKRPQGGNRIPSNQVCKGQHIRGQVDRLSSRAAFRRDLEARDVSWKEPCEIQQRQMLSSAPQKEEPLAMTTCQVGHWQLWDQLSGKDLGVLMESNLRVNWQCALETKNANRILPVILYEQKHNVWTAAEEGSFYPCSSGDHLWHTAILPSPPTTHEKHQ